MRLSLSVRVAEAPKRKDVAAVPIEDLAPMAAAAGFRALSLRASVVSVATPAARRAEIRRLLEVEGLAVSMVTGDIGLAANDASATAALHDIGPYLDLAAAFDCRLVRVMLQEDGDIPRARAAAEAAEARGMTLVQMIHWGTLAETAEEALALVHAVDRPGFRLAYEPANQLGATGRFDPAEIAPLVPYLANVLFQNLREDPGSPIGFPTRRRGHVAVRYAPIDDAGAIDVRLVVAALKDAGYDGWFTIHQPLRDGETVEGSLAAAMDCLGPLVSD